MIDLLSGIPKQLNDLLVRLSSTWAAKIDTLHDSRLTAIRAAYLDNLNLSGKALDDTVWTDTKAGHIDAAITSRLGSIKAIYRGGITLSAGTASATATITAVNTAKCILMPLGSYCSASADVAGTSRIELTNSTTVTAYKHASSAATSVGYQVIEFN